jgi:phage-related protein
MLSHEAIMYDVEYYKSSSGNIPLKDFLLSIKRNDTRKMATIRHYLNMLVEYGPKINENFKKGSSKKLRENLFELRPNNNRILFFYCTNRKIVLLHGFTKTTPKTPNKEIEKAIREINDYNERHLK